MTTSPLLDDRDDLALAGIVDALIDDEAGIAALEADRITQFAAAMRIGTARMAHRPRTVQEREMQIRSIAAEIGAALRWSDRTVQRRMSDALTMVEDYPATLDALAAGRISARHASVIREAGTGIGDAAARTIFEEVVLARAETDTPARTLAFARNIAEQLNPQSLTERHAAAAHGRRVWIEEGADGMADLGIHDAVAKVRAMYDRLTRQARAIRAVADDAAGDGAPSAEAAGGDGVHDERTVDQTRADLACDLILTGQPAIDPTTDRLPGGLGAIRAHVQITIPATTAAGLADRGAAIDGVAPVDAETARRLMAGAPGWDRVLSHPISGIVLAVDRYRPGPLLERLITARDLHCRFPGCRQPAHRCDLDHTHDHARGGPTTATNLACLCRRHHTLKTETPWVAEQLADGGIRWTSPLGRTTTDPPERRVVFAVDGDPPPF